VEFLPMTDPTPELQQDKPWVAKGGLAVAIRPILPEDEPMMARFHQALSPGSVYTRYFNVLKLSRRTSHERLFRVCHPDPDSEAVLVAVVTTPSGGGDIIGVARLTKLPESDAAEAALIVSDAYQRQGLGTELVRRLIEIAERWAVALLTMDILACNLAMQRLCSAAGMTLCDRLDGSDVRAELIL
jgi:acetyltransferase